MTEIYFPSAHEVSLSADESMRQAVDTADTYLRRGIVMIDSHFGDGYAKKNPALLAAFMQTCAADFHTALVKQGAQDIRHGLRGIAEAVEGVAEALANQLSTATLVRPDPSAD